jgi:hypothetical protein
MEKPKVFLSYAREDVKGVEELYDELLEAGIQPWMDTKDLLPGEDWVLGIKSAIQKADFFVACLSRQSVNKRGQLQRELKQAQDLWSEKLEDDIYVIPARLENCDVPQSLTKFQWVDLYDETGFSRLLKSLEVGIERLNVRSNSPQSQPSGASVAPPTQYPPKFFYYISESKVGMLLPQVDRSHVRGKADEPLAMRALRLTEYLERSNLATPLENKPHLQASAFYASKDIWHNGLFCFETLTSSTVAYFLWKQHGDDLIILAGSPDNLIGRRTFSQGIQISSTGDAIDSLGSGEILEVIRTDEVPYVLAGGRSTSDKIPPSIKPFRNVFMPHQSGYKATAYTHSHEIALAIFCLHHLSNLPKLSVETVFRVYSRFESSSGSLFKQLESEYELGRSNYPTLYKDEGLTNAKQLGLDELHTIYIGSPVYTAIG